MSGKCQNQSDCQLPIYFPHAPWAIIFITCPSFPDALGSFPSSAASHLGIGVVTYLPQECFPWHFLEIEALRHGIPVVEVSF